MINWSCNTDNFIDFSYLFCLKLALKGIDTVLARQVLISLDAVIYTVSVQITGVIVFNYFISKHGKQPVLEMEYWGNSQSMQS